MPTPSHVDVWGRNVRNILNPAKTRAALHNAASVSWQLLLVFLLVGVVLWFLGALWSVLWPVVVALLLTTLTWPLARFLRKHGWPPALAAAVVTVIALVVAAGTVVLIVVPVASQSGDLVSGVVDGIQQFRDWASGPPLNVGDDQVTQAFDAAVVKIQGSVGNIITVTLSGVSTVANGVLTAVLAVFLMFFFLKDGPKFLPWLTLQLPGRLAEDVPTIAARSWETLSLFVRSQAFVGLLDAVFIGLGLWIVGVPLVLPLAVLTFVTAFVPIVGALFAGFIAIVIALVFNGPGDALIVLAIILVVQQLEGNVFSPMIQSKGLGLHPAVVLLSVTLGGSLAGIAGSLLAVPAAALFAVLWIYVREQLSDPTPDPSQADDPDPGPFDDESAAQDPMESSPARA